MYAILSRPDGWQFVDDGAPVVALVLALELFERLPVPTETVKVDFERLTVRDHQESGAVALEKLNLIIA